LAHQHRLYMVATVFRSWWFVQNWCFPLADSFLISLSPPRPRHRNILRLLSGDNRTDVFPVERSREVAWFETIDYLNGAPVGRISHHVENAALNNQIPQIKLLQFGESNFSYELRVAVLFRIRRVQAFFIFHKDHRSRPKYLTNQIAAGVCSVRWDASYRRIGVPVDVRRHAKENHRPTFSQIVGQLSKLCRLNKGDSVLCQQIIQHPGVL